MIEKNNNNRVVFIMGSTGVGKTKVAEDVAVKILMDSFSEMHSSKKLKKKKSDDDDDDDDIDDQMVTIVNMDALQVHEELPIATARVLVEDEEEKKKKTRGEVVHELFGVVGIEEEEETTKKKKTKTKKKDVRWFRTSFLEIVEKIWTKRNGKRSVVVCVGGTPYYAKAAMLKTFLPEREASM